jgi:hypothetical protein
VSESDDGRRALLDATAADVGRRLFAIRRDELSCEGRALSGAWPGTLREARALAASVLASVFAERRLSSPTPEELLWVMRAANEEARRVWRASSAEKRPAPRR